MHRGMLHTALSNVNAFNDVQYSSSGRPKTKEMLPQGPVTIDDDTVYLEDVDGSNPLTPTKGKLKERDKESPLSSSKKKSRWQDHDPYLLPEVDMSAAITKATRSSAPDPRLATEDELRYFIAQMKPEDLDVTSPSFRELPTEVQYEILGDLRLKSRQPSHARLAALLRGARTPLEFSRAQIQGLKQRNSLTQSLLETTDSVGKAHISIPIRIAAERNREYVLVRNDDEEGGWVLGIRDDGTRANPIKIDQDVGKPDKEESDDSDMEMVNLDTYVVSDCKYTYCNQLLIFVTRLDPPASASASDPDLRAHRAQNALAGVAKRQQSDRRKPTSRTNVQKISAPPSRSLFIPDEEVHISDAGSEEQIFATAVQASLEEQEAHDLRMALEASRNEQYLAARPTNSSPSRGRSPSPNEDDLYVQTPSRLETALSFASTRRLNADGSPEVTRVSDSPGTPEMGRLSSLFGLPSTLLANEKEVAKVHPPKDVNNGYTTEDAVVRDPAGKTDSVHDDSDSGPTLTDNGQLDHQVDMSSDDDMEEVDVPPASTAPLKAGLSLLSQEGATVAQTEESRTFLASQLPLAGQLDEPRVNATTDIDRTFTPLATNADSPVVAETTSTPDFHSQPLDDPAVLTPSLVDQLQADSALYSLPSDDEQSWSRSPSPEPGLRSTAHHTAHDDFDAAHEMDAHVEEGEFARFVAQVKGKDLDTVRKEIDEEIRVLNQQRKAAMRDSEDVTSMMVAQIMVRLDLLA